MVSPQAVPAPDRVFAHLQRRVVRRHYLRHDPMLPPPLLAMPELRCVDFPRGAVGLAKAIAKSAVDPPPP